MTDAQAQKVIELLEKITEHLKQISHKLGQTTPRP